MKTRTLKPATGKQKYYCPPKGLMEKKDNGIQIQSPYNRCSLYGVALVAAEVYDPDFCIHGPQGCISTIKEAFSIQGKEYEYHHSGMTKDDIIFGGEKTLFKSVADVYSPYEKAGPKFIISSCSSEIIGDNLDAVIARFNEGLPTVKVTGGGFQGDQYFGIDQALVGLISKFASAHPVKRSNMINIIGNIGLSSQWRGDLYELTRLLEDLGLEVNKIGCDSTIENYRLVGNASYTVILSPEVGFLAGEYLQNRFEIPYLYSSLFLPLGLRGTEVWLREIGEVLLIPKERIENLVKREEERVRTELKVGLHQVVYMEKLIYLKGLPVAIIAEGSAAFSWARFVSEELEMKPVFLGMRTGHDNNKLAMALEEWKQESSLSPKVIFKPTLADIKDALKDTKPRFIIGSSVEADLGEEMGIKDFLHITNPNTQYVNINMTPFLGYTGLLYAIETILNTIKN